MKQKNHARLQFDLFLSLSLHLCNRRKSYMSGKRSRSFKCAVHHRDRQVCSENDFHLLLQPPTLFQRMVKVIADEFLTDDRERKYYADRYSCCPPPLFIIFITLVENAGEEPTDRLQYFRV
ncbi:hypothetical protein OUZ56_015130 [Daphnia magna]|uniref:Uncharacterized protein n=1 Tax=Daphnia magna TaxID=35525 RepID=A0ABR0ALW5_9CRUS|nr:hypothetical protein OUZ56_015130 [Daphnia magna]